MKKLILILIFICGFLFVGCKETKQHTRAVGPPKSDVDFAKEVLQMMADENADAADMLDWEHLNMIGKDLGAEYREVSDESSREEFRESFMRGYANSFKATGATVASLQNWREQSKDASQTVVASDAPKERSILIIVTHMNGQQYVSSIQVK